MRKQGKRDQECDGEILGLGMQGLGQRKPGHDRRPHRFPIQRDCRPGRVANPRDSGFPQALYRKTIITRC